MIYVGIDPGLSGAVAAIDDEGPLWVEDTPTCKVEDKNKYLVGAMAGLLKSFAERTDVLVVLENVHSMPKQGVASSFSFGEGKGMWEGILGAYNIPFDLVSPQRWKKEIMADQGKEKSAARFKAMALFPTLAERFKLVKHDGRAEAILMAEYGRRLRQR